MTTQNEGREEAGAAAGEPGAGASPQGLQLDKAQVGAAISKLISASIGDLVVVMSKSPAHKHYSMADIEWMVLPPVLAGQFYVAEAVSPKGSRVPVAFTTWARVSRDVDARIRANIGRPIRLRPDEWSCGEIIWLIDTVGDQRGVTVGLHVLLDGAFNTADVNVIAAGADSAPCARRLSELVESLATEPRMAVS